MTTLTNNNNILTTIENNMTNTPYEYLLQHGITESQERKVENAISSSLIKNKLCTCKQALVASMAFIQNLEGVIYAEINWVENMIAICDSAIIDGEEVEAFDVVDAIRSLGFIEQIGGLYFISDKMIDLINTDTKTQSPILASEGINDSNRLHDYGVKSTRISNLVKDAIHVLETTESIKSDIMLDVAFDVKHILDNSDNKEARDKFYSQDYVLVGTSKLLSDTKYVTEFKADRRFRLYQAACHGFNGQSSDFARSLQDLADVDMNYNVDKVLPILIEELRDMTSLSGDDFELAITKASNNPDVFIAKALILDDKSPIKKPWNFAKFSMLVTQLRNGERPYIGVAVGYDAKCSGPQLGALMTEETKLLMATGFSTKDKESLEDAYEIAIQYVVDAGLPKLTRSDMKKPFMAIFYGAASDSMMDIKTIESGAFFKLYADMHVNGVIGQSTYKQASEVATMFHESVTKAFGKNLSKLRKKIKSLGGMTKNGEFIPFLEDIIEHTMPCGSVVTMNYKKSINLDGEEITREVPATASATISVGNDERKLVNVKFKTNKDDIQSFARTGFVNMIQATDALIARLIVVHARKLGVKNIISIHDCFRVDINNTELLIQAIKNAYMELFGSTTNEPTEHLPASLDIVAEYFKGADKATKEEFKVPYTGGMFHNTSNNKGRKLSKIEGKSIGYLINSLGNGSNDCFYFAK